jgi:hypothetical protein
VSAEFRVLSEEALSGVTAQAGLTIDLETKYTLGELEYVDGGSMFWRDISFQGINTDYVDNIRATVDIASPGEVLQKGFSDVVMLASIGVLDATEPDVAWAIANYDQGGGEYGEVFEDGDLVIHVTSQDFGLDRNNLGASLVDQVQNLENFKNAIDFHFTEEQFGLRSSDDSVETVLTGTMSMQGYLGYLDIVYKNRGNGFHSTGMYDGKPNSIRIGNSWMGFDLGFRIEDLDIDSTNQATNTWLDRSVTNSLLVIKDMRIHNERGRDSEGSFGFASFESKTAAATDILASVDRMAESAMTVTNNIDGMTIYDIEAHMDWDLPHISFGQDNVTIGEVYYTDLIIHSSLVISAH